MNLLRSRLIPKLLWISMIGREKRMLLQFIANSLESSQSAIISLSPPYFDYATFS